MRAIVRVGGLVGAVAFILLYAAQTSIALAVAPGVALAGLCAGLGAAKWLEREWYGRQLSAGLRAGAISSTIAALGALLSLLFLGPRDLATLAARSHLAMLDLAPVVHTLGFLGWTGAEVVTIELAAVAGTILAALACQIFAWSKSAHAIKVVAQARLAAQALNRDDIYRPTGAPVSTYGPAVHVSHLLAQAGVSAPGAISTTMTGITPALGVIPPPTFSPSSVPTPMPVPAPAPVSQRRATAAPASTPAAPASTPAASVPPPMSAERAPTEPALPAAPQSPARANTPPRRSPSAARRAEAELTDAMREALAVWADDTSADPNKPPVMGEKAPPSRAPASSAYLNSSPPAKRGRKKTDTQDWLC